MLKKNNFIMKKSEKEFIRNSRNDILDVIIFAQCCMINSVNTDYFDSFEEIVGKLQTIQQNLSILVPKK